MGLSVGASRLFLGKTDRSAVARLTSATRLQSNIRSTSTAVAVEETRSRAVHGFLGVLDEEGGPHFRLGVPAPSPKNAQQRAAGPDGLIPRPKPQRAPTQRVRWKWAC